MTVFSRCAIVNIVQSLNSLRIVVWMRSSVSRSTADVASSSTRTFVFRKSALAMQISCLCPTLLAKLESSFVFNLFLFQSFYGWRTVNSFLILAYNFNKVTIYIQGFFSFSYMWCVNVFILTHSGHLCWRLFKPDVW